ncbi:MAG: alpha/beta hydrolase [Candidatus Dormibacteraeota bacterium]|nr:alpha/beta hydrolase [Candidatus Dormibacteraeota bacterium]
MVIPSLLGADGRPPHWRRFVQMAAAAAPGPPAEVVLVGHSGAGPLLPQIAASLRPRARGYLFVDAGLPHPTEPTPVAPPEFLAQLRALATGGRLPPWSEWFGEDALRSLLPDDAQRASVTAELPSLPLAYFEESLPAATWWPDAPCGYLWFSEPYASAAAEARGRGWPEVHLPGHHLHLLADPGPVADALVQLLERG